MFRRCRIVVYRAHRVQRVYISVRDVPRIAFPCCNHVRARDPMVDGAFYGRAHSAAMGHDKPEMGQSRTTRRIDFYDFARCFITTRELRREWSLMCGISEKKCLVFPSPLSFFLFHNTRYVYFVPGAETGGRVVFLEQWSNIWCRGNGNIFNNRYGERDACVTAVVVRTCGLFCPMWITRWWNIIDTLGFWTCVLTVKFYASGTVTHDTNF